MRTENCILILFGIFLITLVDVLTAEAMPVEKPYYAVVKRGE